MVDVATGNLSDLAYVAEVTFGTTPGSAVFKKVRRVRTSINLTKETYESEEIRSDRMTADMRHGVRRVSGEIEGELSVASWDDLLEAAVGGTWAAGITKSNTELTSVAADAATKKFTFGGGNPVTEGFRIGDRITFSNMSVAGNNASFTITAIAGSNNREVTVAETVTDQTADTAFNVVVPGKKLVIGNTYRSFSMERSFSELTKYALYKGVRINTAAFSLPPTGMTRITLGLTGQDMAAMSGSSADANSSYSDIATNSPLAAINGSLVEGGVVQAVVTGLEFNLNNNLDGKAVVGSNVLPALLYGNRQQVSGTLTVLFSSETIFNKFINETESSLNVRVDDPNGTDWLKFYFPRLKYGNAEINDADPQGLSVTLPFTALAPTAAADDDSLLVIQRSNT